MDLGAQLGRNTHPNPISLLRAEAYGQDKMTVSLNPKLGAETCGKCGRHKGLRTPPQSRSSLDLLVASRIDKGNHYRRRIYTYTYIYIYSIYTYIHIYIYMYICIYAVYIHIDMNIHIYIYI